MVYGFQIEITGKLDLVVIVPAIFIKHIAFQPLCNRSLLIGRDITFAIIANYTGKWIYEHNGEIASVVIDRWR